MTKQINRKRQRLLQDTKDVKVWYKLYKSGTKWVIASIAVAALGVTAMGTSASADTTADTSSTTTVSAPAQPAESGTGTTDQAQEPTTTESAPITSVADSVLPDAPATPADTTATDPAKAADSASEQPSSPSDSSVTPANTTTPPATTDATAPTPTTTTTPVSADNTPTESTSTPATTADSASNPVMPAAAAVPVTTPPTTTFPLTAEAAKIPQTGTATLGRPIDNLTGPDFQTALQAAILTFTAPDDRGYVTSTDGKYMLASSTWMPGLEPDNSAELEQKYIDNPLIPNDYTISVTNTRIVNGNVELTDKSVVTFVIPSGSITNNTGYPLTSTNPTNYGEQIVPLTADLTADNSNEENRQIKQLFIPNTDSTTLTIPESATLTERADQFGPGGVNLYFQVELATPNQDGNPTNGYMPYVIVGHFNPAVAYQLAPEITNWAKGTSTMSGTGTGAGDTITIKDAAGTVIGTTTVDDSGNWTLDLTGVDQGTALYAEEANDLGDQPGVTAATQFETAYRIIHYVDESGNVLHPEFKQELSVEQENTVTIDPASQEVTWDYGPWEPVNPNLNVFSTVGNPVITNYYTEATVAPGALFSDLDLANITTPINTDVVYHQLADWVPSDPEIAPVTYPNDPANPSGVLDPSSPDAPALPYVPGKTPVGPDGNELTLKDPNDPTKGYIPPTPVDPGQSTPIDYVTDPTVIETQKGTVTYQDINDPANPLPLGEADSLSGDSGTTSDYRTADRIKELTAAGYLLDNDPYPATGVVFDDDPTQDQAFVVTFKHATATITPEKPGVPGTPIDSENPEGPKWPAGSDDVTTLTHDVKETITYVNDDGSEAAPTYTDTISFTRDATVDLVTGAVTPNATWTAPADTTFDTVPSPVISGYFANPASVDEIASVTAETADITQQVVYQKLGNWVTTEPGITPTPYPNNSDNAGGILDPTDPKAPVIPDVPGKTPQGPDGKPLTPKDPSDPTQGYIPPTPEDLGKDTTITYVDNDNGSGNPGTGGETGTTPGTDGGTDTTPGTGGETGTTPGTGNGTDTTPGTGGETGTTPGTDGGTDTTPGTGNGTGTTPGTGGSTTPTVTPETPAPADAQSPTTPTETAGPGTGTQTSTGPTNLGAPQVPATGSTGSTVTISAPTSTPATTAQASTNNSNTGQTLPQTDETTGVWARIGLALLGALGLAGLAERRRKRN